MPTAVALHPRPHIQKQDFCTSVSCAFLVTSSLLQTQINVILNANPLYSKRTPTDASRCLTLLIIDSCRGPTLRTQNAALISNAYAKLARNDSSLLAHLALELTLVPTSAFVGPPGARDLSNLLNSYARLRYRDVALLVHLTSSARRLHMTGCQFGAQAIANIMNAAARLDFTSDELNRDMAQATLLVRPEHFDTQAISVIMNSLSKAGECAPQVLTHLHRAISCMQPTDWTGQAVGITVNGLANLKYPEAGALRLMRDAAMTLSPTGVRALDPQALANIVNAFARPHVMELLDTQPLFDRMADIALELSPLKYSAQAAALTARAFAKPTVARAVGGRAELVIGKVAELSETFPAADWSPQAAAMMMLSVAEVPVPCSISTTRYLNQVLLGMTHYQLGPGAMRSIAMVCAAIEQLDVCDLALLRHLSHCIQRSPLSIMRPMWVRSISTCYVHFKEAQLDLPLMEFLSQATQHIHPSINGHNSPATVNEFSARDLALIARSFGSLQGQQHTDQSLFWHLAAVAQQLPFEAWLPRDLADFCDAFVSSGQRDDMIFDYLSRAAQHRSPFDFSPTTAKLMLSAFSRAQIQDSELYAHLAEAVGAGDGASVIFTLPDEGTERSWVGAGTDAKIAQLIKQSQRNSQQSAALDLWIPGSTEAVPDLEGLEWRDFFNNDSEEIEESSGF